MKNKTTLILLTLLIITISITISYAYMRSTLNNNQNMQASVVTGTMRLTFSDGTTGQVLANLNMGDSSTPKDLILENTGTLPVSGTISWNNLTNTYTQGSLTYVLNRKTSLSGSYTRVAQGNVPVGTNVQSPIYAEKDMPAGAKYYYQLIITFNDLPTVDQTTDAEAQMKTSFTVLEGVQTLADISLAHLVNTTVQETPTTYNMFNYTYNGYYADINSEDTLHNDSIPTTEGLYTMEDDFGTSYYFRGSNNLNNVVKFGKYQTDMYYYENRYYYEEFNRLVSANPKNYFASFLKAMGDNNMEVNTGAYSTGSYEQCMNEAYNTSNCSNANYKYSNAGDDMYWRILRINGDGTVRLLYIGTEPTNSDNLAGHSPFNKEWNNPKYSGYTFDNSAPDAGDGTSSDIKKYLETWYERALINQDSGIATGQYFYDSSGYSRNDLLSTFEGTDIYAYSSILRLEKNLAGNTQNVDPKLTTHSTTENYGGIYNSKVGLASIDELVLSGYDGVLGAWQYGNRSTYPYSTNTSEFFWTGSHAAYYTEDPTVFDVGSNGRLNDYSVNIPHVAVAPVVNLTTENWAQMIGEGSVSNPYRLSIESN